MRRHQAWHLARMQAGTYMQSQATGLLLAPVIVSAACCSHHSQPACLFVQVMDEGTSTKIINALADKVFLTPSTRQVTMAGGLGQSSLLDHKVRAAGQQLVLQPGVRATCRGTCYVYYACSASKPAAKPYPSLHLAKRQLCLWCSSSISILLVLL